MIRRGIARRWLAGCLWVASAFLVAASPGAGKGKALEQRVQARLRERHFSRSQVDPAKVERSVKAQLRADPTLIRAHSLDDIIVNEIGLEFYRFAPRGAEPDPNVLYELPYDARIPRRCIRGAGGLETHVGTHYYAWDFEMPRGTEVRAARAGLVTRVVDGFTRGGEDKSFAYKANFVVVLHDDGTFAEYVHFSPGISVKEGQRVKVGTVLGRSGSTGWASEPHLHFEVRHLRENGWRESIPIRFDGRIGGPFVPKESVYYGFLPDPTVAMRVFAGKTLVQGKGPVTLVRGAELPLRVEILKRGKARDVSRDARVRIVTLTPWDLTVAGPARVAARMTPGFDRLASERLPNGVFMVYYGLDGGPDLGVRMIDVTLSP